MFIGRKSELDFLNNQYKTQNAEFIVLYGRRRVGKTETLTEFCKDKPNIFYACNDYTDKKQFSAFTDALLDYDYSARKQIRRFSDWEDAFSHLGDIPTKDKLVIVIDEFPYMCKNNKSIPSILQNLWDHKLRNANIMLIICGSSMSFIEDEILASKNPLYGRTTGIYKMEQMPFYDAIQFFPNYSVEDKIIAYSILGGIPHYLKQFDPTLSIEENIKSKILTKGTVLFGETEYILHQELRETSVYTTILESISVGNNRFSEICESAQIESERLPFYLKSLLELGIIIREFPAMSTVKQYAKRQQGEYKVADNFFKFWFAYVYKYMSELSKGETQNIWQYVIKNDLHNFASKAFENVSIEYLRKLNRTASLPFPFLSIGRWWGKVTRIDEKSQKPVSGSEEIDIVASDKDEKNFIIGECKFTNESFDLGQLKDLKAKITFPGNQYYYLFALNGFTDAVKKEAASSDNITLVKAEDMLSN